MASEASHAALSQYDILDTPAEQAFDDIALLASRACETPVALVSFVTSDRQWFKARIGFPTCQTPLSQSVCALALEQAATFVIPDLTLDERTKDNALVIQAPFIRFYAGALLRSLGGTPIGTICVIDTKPRPEGLTELQRSSLEALARQVMAQLELRRLLAQQDQKVQERTRERDGIWLVSRDMLGVADPEGVWLSVNPAWTEILGWSEAEIVGRTTRWLQHPEDLDRTQAGRDSVKAGQALLVFENRLRTRDGGYRVISWKAIPHEGRTYGVARDVTAEREQGRALANAEEALRHSQKMEAVGQLTGGIAHDFNNMLQAIGGNLEVMQRRVEQGRPAEVAHLVDSACATVARAAALTHRLLAFARRQTLQPKPVMADTLIRGIEVLLRQTVGPAIAVELRMFDGTWPVLCDPNQLENVLLNLAINARDAMPSGGRLTVTTRHVHLSRADVADQEGATPGDFVEIAVADTGTGMDEATRARAFEPFFTTKPIGQGTGLGLSQLYGFVRQSGGAVQLDSEPGQGTAVRVFMPRQEDAHHADDAPALNGEPSNAGAGETVLLVEDETEVRTIVADHLRDLGYAVLEAADGPAALRMLRSGRQVDLLVTDVGLPGGMNGRQVADAVRERLPVLPALFITGYAGSMLQEQLAPGMDVISKPFRLDALVTRMRAMLDAATGQ